MLDYTDLLVQVTGLRALVGAAIEGCTMEREYSTLTTVEDLLMVAEQELTSYVIMEKRSLEE